MRLPYPALLTWGFASSHLPIPHPPSPASLSYSYIYAAALFVFFSLRYEAFEMVGPREVLVMAS